MTVETGQNDTQSLISVSTVTLYQTLPVTLLLVPKVWEGVFITGLADFHLKTQYYLR